MRRVLVSLLLALSSLPSVASDKYPLSMSVVYTKGQSKSSLAKDATYQSGDYYCTHGTENSAPDCRTITEWAELDAIGGTPDTAVFTMADGTVVKVQSNSVNKLPGHILCYPSTDMLFCSLFYDLLGISLPPMTHTVMISGYPQTSQATTEEMDAYTKKLFGSGNSFTLSIPYKLKGKIDKQGFQRIEVEMDTLPPDSNSPRSKQSIGSAYHVEATSH